MRRALRATVLLLLATACGPITGAGRARTLPVGRNEVSAGLEALLIAPRLRETNVALPWLQFGAGFHRGVGERLELGARLWGLSLGQRADFKTWGGALDGKLQLRRATPTGGRDVALAPSVTYHQIAFGGWPQHQAGAAVPLLIGVTLSERTQLVLGPRLAYQAWFGESQHTQHLLFAGASVALVWQWSPRFALAPELGLLYSPVQFGGEDPRGDQRGLTFLGLGLGVGLGW